MKATSLGRAMKRLFDLGVASVALFIFLPLMGAVACLIWFSSGRPIVYRQVRPGRDGKPFRIRKFRTMNEAKDDEGNLLHPSLRITRIGRILRSTSLDELPQLWNVVRGEMSIVGPRPLRMEYLPRYSPEQRRRHEVLPGITGWSQVMGRNLLTWDERLRLDVWYVDNWSFLLDMKILWLTVVQVFRRHGVYTESGDIMPEFQGNGED